MINCPNCGQETENGKFCTKCGAKLVVEESAATSDSTATNFDSTRQSMEQPVQQPPVQQNSSGSTPQKNEAVEKLKLAGSNFGHFFMTLLKKPTEAQKSNGNDIVSAIITLVIFALLPVLRMYFIAREIAWEDDIFMSYFVKPFFQFIILFTILIVMTFGATKLLAQKISFTDVIGKYGAYSIPFLLLMVLGLLLSFTDFSFFLTIILISMFGILMLVPTFIILEQPAIGLDRIYILIIFYVISFFMASLLLQSMIETITGSILGGIMNGFNSLFD